MSSPNPPGPSGSSTPPDPPGPAALLAHLGALPSPFRGDLDAAADFAAGWTTRAAGPVRVDRYEVHGVQGHAERRAARAGTPEVLTVALVDRGRVSVEHGAHLASLGRGTATVTTSALPLGLRVERHVRLLTVAVPLDLVAAPGAPLDALYGRPLDVRRPAVASVLRSLRGTASDVADRVDPGWGTVGEAVVGLVRALVVLASDTPEPEEPTARTLDDRVMTYLQEHALDAGMTARQIADAHDISVRYLYVILARLGVSLGSWLRSARLENAAAVLQHRNSVSLQIADVALGSGFADHAHFSRSFRDRFGVSPSEWRDAVEPAAPVEP